MDRPVYMTHNSKKKRLKQYRDLLNSNDIDKLLIPWIPKFNCLRGLVVNQHCAGTGPTGSANNAKTHEEIDADIRRGYISLEMSERVAHGIVAYSKKFSACDVVNEFTLQYEQVYDKLVCDVVFWWQPKQFEKAIRLVYSIMKWIARNYKGDNIMMQKTEKSCNVCGTQYEEAENIIGGGLLPEHTWVCSDECYEKYCDEMENNVDTKG